ncbi:MAG: BsuPI-related putative proteinase inhibitor [Chthoniobacterales bacterium]
MKRVLVPLLIAAAMSANAFAQDTDSSGERRGWMSRMLHPFGGGDQLPDYKDPQLRGLALSLRLAPQPVKLSENRQMEVTIRLTNKGRKPITLEFPSTQRFEIYLLNAAGKVLTAWSDNHAFSDEPASIMINPQEHVEYAETIATRELAANKVFTCEVYFPKYPELRVQQKFLTAP